LNKQAGPEALNFIVDAPSEVDALKTHSRVAKAIVGVVRDNRRIKTIGLLGGWGSGKSTVIRLMQAELEQTSREGEIHCFTYDAWLHQSDPPRRAFLEALVAYLIHRPGFDDLSGSDDRWRSKLEALNKQTETIQTTTTPTLTQSGVWMLLTVLFLPLGTRLIGDGAIEYDLQSDPASMLTFLLGWLLTTGPIWVAGLIYLSWRPWGARIDRRFFTTHKPAHAGQSILSVIANRQVEQKHELKAKPPEPTAIEFQDAFREIMAQAQTPRRRLVIIIDNLDRLPPKEAMTIWATIRSFFLGADGGARALDRADLPTVIMPIDEASVSRMMHEAAADDEHLSRSFIEKTFDLVFHVPVPVLSRWREYLRLRLVEVFGATMPADWPHIVGTIYETHLARVGEKPTPRTINTFINAIATLWMQRTDDPVHIGLIAHFITIRGALARDIYAAVQAENDVLSGFNAEWRTAIAALHFGVDVADADELFMDTPLRTAIGGNDASGFQKLADTPGFDSYFLKILNQPDASETISAGSSAVLLHGLGRGDEPWVAAVWRRLRQLFIDNLDHLPPGVPDAHALGLLVDSAQKPDRPAFLRAMSDRLGRLPPTIITRDDGQVFFKIASRLIEKAQAETLSGFEVKTPGGATEYMLVLAVQEATAPVRAAIVPGGATMDEVAAHVATTLRDPAASNTAALAALSLAELDQPALDWGPILDASADLLQSGDASRITVVAAMLRGLFVRLPAIEGRVRAFRDQSILNRALNEVWHGEADRPIAEVTALLWRVDGAADPPDGRGWNVRISELPDLPRLIDESLLAMQTPIELRQLMQRSRDRPNEAPLCRAIAARRLDSDPSNLPPSDLLLADSEGFNELMAPDQRPAFWGTASAQDGFWEQLEALPIDRAAPILHAIVASDVNKSRLGKALQKLLNAASEADWQGAINSGLEPMSLVLALDRLDRSTVTLGDGLGTLLRAHVGNLEGTAEEHFRGRWFALARRLTPAGRKTAFKLLRDTLTRGTPIENLLQLLTLGGPSLLTEGEFRKAADGAILHIVLPLTQSEVGRRWLLDNSAEVSRWVAMADEPSRAALGETLASQREVDAPLSADLQSGLLGPATSQPPLGGMETS